MTIRFRDHLPARLLLVAVAAFLGSGPAAAADLRGRVELVNDGGKEVPGVRQVIVYYTPRDGAPPAAPVPVTPPAAPFEIATARKDFQPRVLAVPVGATVSFPNRDPILHNVFSVSGRNRFDLGLYRGGESKSTTFEAPGVVQVYCNVHHSMAAYVVVLETPFHTRPGTDGEFRLTGLPPGPGTLTAWHAQTEAWTAEVDPTTAGPLAIRLEIVRKRVQKHTNKFGKPYSRKRRGKDYD